MAEKPRGRGEGWGDKLIQDDFTYKDILKTTGVIWDMGKASGVNGWAPSLLRKLGAIGFFGTAMPLKTTAVSTRYALNGLGGVFKKILYDSNPESRSLLSHAIGRTIGFTKEAIINAGIARVANFGVATTAALARPFKHLAGSLVSGTRATINSATGIIASPFAAVTKTAKWTTNLLGLKFLDSVDGKVSGFVGDRFKDAGGHISESWESGKSTILSVPGGAVDIAKSAVGNIVTATKHLLKAYVTDVKPSEIVQKAENYYDNTINKGVLNYLNAIATIKNKDEREKAYANLLKWLSNLNDSDNTLSSTT